jgi:undecaprenyl-diphosphatase
LILFKILILAIIQGAAELLPVSSSAHVIVAEKLMGLDPVSPEMTLLLVMLHTGTMFAVIVYFWRAWRVNYFSSREAFMRFAKLVVVATAFTGVVGLLLKSFIEKVVFRNVAHAEVELLFGNMTMIAVSLFVVGLFIIYAGIKANRSSDTSSLGFKESSWIGAIQGLCLPFRGFSRSGATISMGLTLCIGKVRAEEFSFALAVVLTPPVIAREVLRLLHAHSASLSQASPLLTLFYPSFVAMVLSFISGLLALRWLSRWLERGLWHVFGYYCLAASIVVFTLHSMSLI